MTDNARQQAILAIYNKRPDFYTDVRVFNSVPKMNQRICAIDELLLQHQCPEKSKLEMERLLLLNKIQFWYPMPYSEDANLRALYTNVFNLLCDSQNRYTEEKNEEQEELKRRHIVLLLHTIFCNLSFEQLREEEEASL
jgi:hypothetical protein